MPKASPFPEGISESHVKGRDWRRYASVAAVLALGLFLGAALMGVFGGQPHPTRIVETPEARIALQLPERLRNGEFFEMRSTIRAKRDFTDATLVVSSGYFRDLTINTMIPAPTEEKSENGVYAFSYGELKTGDTLTIKIDGQINPSIFGGTEGTILLRDGDIPIATIPVRLRVLP
ncbi:MAG: hypothetical protein ACRCY3_06650 [Sphingorhabdus sp.]